MLRNDDARSPIPPDTCSALGFAVDSRAVADRIWPLSARSFR